MEEFCFIFYELFLNLKLISVDKLCKEGEMMMWKFICKLFIFLGNFFIIMIWEFKNDEEIYVLIGIDFDVEFVVSFCRGLFVVFIDDLWMVIGVVICLLNGDFELFFLK